MQVKVPASSSISSKGQITVPAEIRQRLGLKTGDKVEFVIDAGRTILRPARRQLNPFEDFVGCLKVFESRHAINEWVAEMRDEAE